MKEPTVFGKYDSEKTLNYPERRFDLDRKPSSPKNLQTSRQDAAGKLSEAKPSYMSQIGLFAQ